MTRGIGASLAHRNFRLFFAGQLVSLVGTWMQTVAQGWLVLTLTDDPFALGVVTACQFLPVLLFGLFGGVIADALPKRQTLIVTQIVALILALTLGVLVVTDQVQVWMIYLLAIGLGFVNAVEMPVRQSFVVEMVGRPDVANAIALNSATFNLARVVGPAVAGLIIGLVGIAACFFLNAASFLAVLVAYLLMRDSELLPSPRIAVPHSVSAIATQLREGLGYVRHTPTVRLAIVTLGVVATAGMNFSVLVPVYAKDTLGGNATTYGFLMAATGAGSLTCALMIAGGLRPTLRLLVAGAAVLGASLVTLALIKNELLALPVMLLLGWSVIAIAATTNTLIQMTVPDRLRGRVMSIYTTVFAGSSPIGGLFAGAIAAAAGVAAALAIGGAVAIGAAAVAGVRARAMPSSQGGPRAASQGIG
ncbi:MAG TPA: MFS transporter [Candidatus Limnocylindrales bacterium]|jgi:predicted MFS family arabinose efflux permease